MTATQVEQQPHPGVQAELWERVTGIPAVWLAAHPVFAARWLRVRAVGLWLGLLWVLALLVLVPDVRGSVRAYVGSFVLLVVWFVLVRTKTVSWCTTARLFGACVAWSAAIGLFTLWVADQIGLEPRSDGAGIALAGFLEESGKLVPLLVLVLVAPGRVRRFAAGDWAVLGFASGVAFNAFEDSLRQIALLRNVFRFLVDSSQDYSLNPWTSGGFVSPDGVAVSFGHHIWTATTAMGIGLGITWWRSGWRGARVGALVFPGLVILLAIAEHASFNARNGDASWPDQGGEGFSPILAVLWAMTGHGRAVGVLSVVLLVASLAVDVHRRHNAVLRSPALDGMRLRPAGAVTETEPGLRAVAWWLERVSPPLGPTTPRPPVARVGLRVAGTAGALFLRAVAQWSGDVGVVLASHARIGGEPRRDAVRRGRAVAIKVRGVRVEAMTVTTPGLEPSARRAFARAGAILGILALVASVAWGTHMAAAIGPSLGLEGDGTYLAGLLDSVANWWQGLNPGQQIAVGLGIAALIALSGGSLGLAFGLSGAATYGLSHTSGAATFARNPYAATTSYVTTTTPLETFTDIGEFALTFAPGNFAGAVAGRGARLLSEEIAHDPAAFAASRRAARYADREGGHIDLGAFMRRDPIQLADGTPLVARDAASEPAVVARYEKYRASRVLAKGDAGDYQVGLYGANERVIPIGAGKSAIPDGLTSSYGALADAKFVRAEGSSFYLPDTISNERVARMAVAQMDAKLVKLGKAAQAFDGSSGVVEIATNNPIAARLFESRMRALGIRGYIRLEP